MAFNADHPGAQRPANLFREVERHELCLAWLRLLDGHRHLGPRGETVFEQDLPDLLRPAESRLFLEADRELRFVD